MRDTNVSHQNARTTACARWREVLLPVRREMMRRCWDEEGDLEGIKRRRRSCAANQSTERAKVNKKDGGGGAAEVIKRRRGGNQSGWENGGGVCLQLGHLGSRKEMTVMRGNVFRTKGKCVVCERLSLSYTSLHELEDRSRKGCAAEGTKLKRPQTHRAINSPKKRAVGPWQRRPRPRSSLGWKVASGR